MTVIEYMGYMGKIEDFAKKKSEENRFKNGKTFDEMFFQVTPEWSFKDDKTILVDGSKYKLSNIFGTNKVSVSELKDMTNKVVQMISIRKGIDKSKISKIKVSSSSIQFYFEGEDVDSLRSGLFFTLGDIYDLCDLKNYTRPGNPFKDYDTSKHHKVSINDIELTMNPAVMKLNINSIADELKFQGFNLLLRQKINREDNINEYYYLFAHKVGVIVVLKELLGDVTGSIFIFCKKDTNNMYSILKGWDGGGNHYRKDIYLGFTNDLKKAYDLSDTEWVCGFPDRHTFSIFCIYSGVKSLEYLGGAIREKKGGENRYIMLNDVYSSHELGMLCSYYENKVIFDKIRKGVLSIPKNLPQTYYRDSLNKFKEVYPKEVSVSSECIKRINKAYGIKT